MKRILSRLSTPTKILFPYVFLTQFVSLCYEAFQLSPPFLFEYISFFGFFWLIAWWLAEDSRRTGVSWPIDTGMLLYVAWMFLLPYHLFKTRGIRAMIGILAMAGTILAAWLIVAILIVLIWY